MGECGELQVCGILIFCGYWNCLEVMFESFVEGCWFKIGDVVMIDEDGFVFIVDCIKDFVICGGENIGCGQVEVVLFEYLMVFEVCVFVVLDDCLGEEVGVMVYLCELIDEGELWEFLLECLVKFEVFCYFFFMSEVLLCIVLGKIFKCGLCEEVVN